MHDIRKLPTKNTFILMRYYSFNAHFYIFFYFLHWVAYLQFMQHVEIIQCSNYKIIIFINSHNNKQNNTVKCYLSLIIIREWILSFHIYLLTLCN